MQTYIYHWEIYYKVVATGSYTGISDIVEYLEQLLPSSGYVVCPGLKKYPEQVRFKTKHLVEFGSPFPRLISDQCSMWHIPNLAQQHNESQLCKACVKLQHDVKYLVSRADSTTEANKTARSLPNSKYPLSKLSPESQKKRMKNTTVERKQLISKVNHLTRFDCEVSEKQHDELLKMVTSINDKGSKALKELIAEGENRLEESNLLKESWKQDVLERLSFEKDQQKSG